MEGNVLGEADDLVPESPDVVDHAGALEGLDDRHERVRADVELVGDDGLEGHSVGDHVLPAHERGQARSHADHARVGERCKGGAVWVHVPEAGVHIAASQPGLEILQALAQLAPFSLAKFASSRPGEALGGASSPEDKGSHASRTALPAGSSHLIVPTPPERHGQSCVTSRSVSGARL